MAYGPQGITPDYAYQQRTTGGAPTKSGWDYALGGLGALSQAAIPAYMQYRQMQNAQPPTAQPQGATATPNAVPGSQKKPMIGQPAAPTPEEEQKAPTWQARLQAALDQLIAQKTGMMMGQGQNYPMGLYQNAFQAADQQSGGQGVPQWNQGSGGFDFNQFMGMGQQYNPLAALSDPSIGEEPEKTGFAGFMNKLGSGLRSNAGSIGMLGGALGPLGLLAGPAAGLIGYGLEQIT